MTITEVCAIIGIALVATTVAVTVVLGGDMLRREWLRKRRWKRLEREVGLSSRPSEARGGILMETARKDREEDNHGN